MIHKSVPGSAPESPGSGGSFDMSIGTAPKEWVSAEHESPIAGDDRSALSRAARFDVVPTGSRESTFVANISGLGASLLAGTAWYLLDLVGLYSGPWLAPVLAVIIAGSIRLTSGTEPAYRAVVAVGFYLLTLVTVLAFLTYGDLTDIYGSVDSFQVYEDTLFRTKLGDPLHLAAYGIGVLLAARIGYFRARVSSR